MSTAAYFSVVCDAENCQEESTVEPTRRQALITARYRDGYVNVRRDGRRFDYCPDHANRGLPPAGRVQR